MKKYQLAGFIAIFLLASSTAFSQQNIKGLVNAEKQFALFTASHTVRDGFLGYMDSAGVVFRQGNAVNALETFQKQKPGPAILSWEPVFALISASGDMGVTAGPYEIRTKSLQDTPVGRGSFSSIWQINKKGEWKNMADLGVSYNASPLAVKEVKEISLVKTKELTIVYDEVLALDKKLNTAIQGKNISVLAPYISADSWLNIEGQTPIIGAKKISTALQNIPSGLMLSSGAGGLSASKDFAYVYGYVVNGEKKENYLRAWVYRDKQWHVILQTLKW